MAGQTGARGETVGPNGSLRTLLLVPFALLAFAGVVVLLMKVTSSPTAFLPDFPILIDALLLTVLVSVCFYGAFRISDLVRGLLRR